MKILLDESLPRKLRSDFGSEHEVWTVRDKGWLGKKNGELLKLLIADNFEIFITVDKNLPYQQNLERLPLTIFVLKAKDNRRSTLQKLIPLVFESISIGNLQNVIEIFHI
jgi:predicted nuclease of predicted toxin-antitoxin system